MRSNTASPFRSVTNPLPHPASGYYEWQITDRQAALDFTRADGEPTTFAGLWDEWKDKATGEALKSDFVELAARDDNAVAHHILPTRVLRFGFRQRFRKLAPIAERGPKLRRASLSWCPTVAKITMKRVRHQERQQADASLAVA
jgi:hypothetical protein